ncbi:MAG: PA2779 family protein [Pseudomonadota bacterium]
MGKSFVRFVSGVLIPCVLALPLQAQAGMLGTGEAVAAAQAQAARDALRSLVGRAGAAGKLEALGVTPQAALERVAALTDAEAAALAERIERLPAGADGAGFGLVLVAIFLFYLFVWVPSHTPETKKPEPGKKK